MFLLEKIQQNGQAAFGCFEHDWVKDIKPNLSRTKHYPFYYNSLGATCYIRKET